MINSFRPKFTNVFWLKNKFEIWYNVVKFLCYIIFF
nr:MAG TPA: hypothetical protein [Caudoviricetes sp.]